MSLGGTIGLIPHGKRFEMLTISAVPNIMMFCEGSRSMIMLKVSQIFANANQENMREKILY